MIIYVKLSLPYFQSDWFICNSLLHCIPDLSKWTFWNSNFRKSSGRFDETSDSDVRCLYQRQRFFPQWFSPAMIFLCVVILTNCSLFTFNIFIMFLKVRTFVLFLYLTMHLYIHKNTQWKRLAFFKLSWKKKTICVWPLPVRRSREHALWINYSLLSSSVTKPWQPTQTIQIFSKEGGFKKDSFTVRIFQAVQEHNNKWQFSFKEINNFKATFSRGFRIGQNSDKNSNQ